jgi:hypothetical protein
MADHKRVGIFGWGVVAPKSPNVTAFERNLEHADSWPNPSRLRQSNFVEPEFDSKHITALDDGLLREVRAVRPKDGPMQSRDRASFNSYRKIPNRDVPAVS